MKIVSILTTLLWTISKVYGDDHTTVSVDEWVLGATLAARDFVVGETITFEWNGLHDVHIHPTGDCTEDGAIEISVTSPANYTFTEEDAAAGTVFFACDVGGHCENGGMSLVANVASAGMDAPSPTPPAPTPGRYDSGSIGYGLAVSIFVVLSALFL